jgi:rubrerythrin
VAAAAAAPRALARQPSAPALPDEDVLVLERLLELERTLAVAYELAVARGVLDPEVQAAAELFAEQEREHAETLASALVDLGGPSPGPPQPDEIDGLSDLESQPAVLEFLAARERQAIALYGEAATRLTEPDLLRTGAQIVGNEAQHLVVLRQQLGEEPVPDVFPPGRAGEGSGPAGG